MTKQSRAKAPKLPAIRAGQLVTLLIAYEGSAHFRLNHKYRVLGVSLCGRHIELQHDIRREVRACFIESEVSL